MDTDRRMNPGEADQALRDLFHAAGHEAVPEGFDARILQRIAVVKPIAAVADQPLLPKSAWIAGSLLLAATLTYSIITSSHGATDAHSLPWQLPKLDLAAVFSSPWLVMASVAAAIFLAVDTLLSRTVSARSRG